MLESSSFFAITLFFIKNKNNARNEYSEKNHKQVNEY